MTVADAKPASEPSPPSSPRPQAWWQWWLMYPGLAIAILGAIPTAIQAVQALHLGLPFSDVPYATKKNDLFTKNFDCLKKIGPSLQLKDNTEVQATICDSGDIWIRVTTAESQTGITWVSPSDVIANKRAGLIVREAFGASAPSLAQAGAQVLCVFKDSSGKIIRRIALAPGKCQDEQIDPYTGAVTVVAASCSCP